MARNNLEERLIDFAVLIVKIIKRIPNTIAGKHLSSQLIRSGTSPALNYGEAQGAESRKDFIHKLKVVLKELRESHINLRIIDKGQILPNDVDVLYGIKESDELVAIFIKSIETARKNLPKEEN
jgi:four helix bundle protein